MDYAASIQQQIGAARARAERLRLRASEAGATADPFLAVALEEVFTALEELQVSEEELRAQNESLAAAQLQLEEEHQHYLDLFHFAPDAYLVTDAGGVVREANRAAGALLGMRDPSLVGKPLAVFVAPRCMRDFRTRLARLGEGRVEEWELSLVPRDGRAVDVACTVEPAAARGGRPEFRWLVRDVSARRAAQEAERQLAAEQAARAEAEAAAARTHALLESIGDAFLSLDGEGRMTYLNGRALAYVRQAAGEGADPVDRSVWELFPGAAEGPWRVALDGVLAGGGAATFEAFSPPLGLWLEARAYPTPDGLSLFLTDVTGRRRRAEADGLLARASEILAGSLEYAATLQSIADLVAGSLADYCIVHVEVDGEIRAPGIAHADPARRDIVRGLLRRFPVDPAGPHPAVVALRTGEPQLLAEVPPALMAEIARHDPEHLEMLRGLGLKSAIVVPMKARGRTVGAVSMGRAGGAPYDARDLETAVELARRAALAVDNARLYEEARRATAAREEVLAVVSHDLRNPLNAVLVGATILEEFSDPSAWSERDRRQIQAIRGSAQQMTSLIQDLVEVVALESGRRPHNPERVDAAALVEGVADMYRELAAQQGIRLNVELADVLPAVRADRGRVLQVFGNLLGNALKFTPEGGTVTLGAAFSGSSVGFFVADTGPGLLPEQAARVFDRFWQARRGEQKGLGLGLAIARAIVEAHGGRIWVESGGPGTGSTFFFTLPVWEEPASSAAD